MAISWRRRAEAFWNLLVLQIASHQRLSWPWAVVAGLVFPLLLLYVFTTMMERTSTAFLVHLVAGNVLISLVLSVLSKTALTVTYLRQTGSIDYYATLPVSKLALLSSLMISFLLQALPGAAVLVALAAFVLDLPIALHPLLLLVLPLAAFCMAALGTLIGTLCPDVLTARLASQLATATMIGASPILIPLEKFPQALRAVSALLPSTYAVSALRATLIGDGGTGVWRDTAVLALFSLALIAAVAHYLPWHRR